MSCDARRERREGDCARRRRRRGICLGRRSGAPAGPGDRGRARVERPPVRQRPELDGVRLRRRHIVDGVSMRCLRFRAPVGAPVVRGVARQHDQRRGDRGLPDRYADSACANEYHQCDGQQHTAEKRPVAVDECRARVAEALCVDMHVNHARDELGRCAEEDEEQEGINGEGRGEEGKDNGRGVCEEGEGEGAGEDEVGWVGRDEDNRG
jgi:hypothetical protein